MGIPIRVGEVPSLHELLPRFMFRMRYGVLKRPSDPAREAKHFSGNQRTLTLSNACSASSRLASIAKRKGVMSKAGFESFCLGESRLQADEAETRGLRASSRLRS